MTEKAKTTWKAIGAVITIIIAAVGAYAALVSAGVLDNPRAAKTTITTRAFQAEVITGPDKTGLAATNSPGETTTTPESKEYNIGDDTDFTAQWPDNQFTRQVPKPDFAVSFGSISETEYVALSDIVTVQQLRNYVIKLQKAGFSQNAESTDEYVFGLSLFSYVADNGKGYQVDVEVTSSTATSIAASVTIRKL